MARAYVALLAMTAHASRLLPPMRNSDLPLSGKRILVSSPWIEGAPLSSELVRKGARPFWCEAVRAEPLSDLGLLDDALMRLAEYDILVVLDPHSIDAMAERWPSLAKFSNNRMKSIQVGAIGTDARLFTERMGSGVSLVPREPSASGLVTTLKALDYTKAGARVLVTTGRISSGSDSVGSGEGDSAGAETLPQNVMTVLEQLQADGVDVDVVDTHSLTVGTSAEMEVEIQLLRAGAIDAICAASAEELNALIMVAGGTEGLLSDGKILPVIVALGEETAAAAEKLLPDAIILALGARPNVRDVVAALSEQFVERKLVF